MNSLLAPLTLGFILLGMLIPSQAAVIASYDIIDDAFNSTSGLYTGPGFYDLFNATNGTTTGDGQNDIQVIVSPFGAGNVAGVTYTSTVAASTTTGLVSSVSVSGASASNNNGHRLGVMIDICFLNGMTVLASNITDYSFSSGNSSGITWEVSQLMYLDAGYDVIGAVPVINPYLSHTPINGISANSAVADGLGSVTGVGTSDVTAGSDGSNDSLLSSYDTPVELGISGSTLIGGVRFIYFLEDVRGTTDSSSNLTNTINDLQLTNFTVVTVPEPSRAVLFLGALGWIALRRRRI
jgi:hypothetical protein